MSHFSRLQQVSPKPSVNIIMVTMAHLWTIYPFNWWIFRRFHQVHLQCRSSSSRWSPQRRRNVSSPGRDSTSGHDFGQEGRPWAEENRRRTLENGPLKSVIFQARNLHSVRGFSNGRSLNFGDKILLDGWETRFEAPIGSPLQKEYIENVGTSSSLVPS